MSLHIIGIDLGATSGRVVLATFSQGGISTEELHRFRHSLTQIDGKYYWDIYSLYDQIKQGLAVAGSRGLEIASIGIDTWGVDFVYVGEDGALLGLPRAYRDPYTKGMPEEFFRKVPRREVYERTGIQFMDFNSLFQLYAAQREGVSARRYAETVLFMPDALSYLLTGEKVCEYSILSTSQLMNPRTGELDEVLLEAAGISADKFSRRVMPGERIGTLSEAVGRETGLGAIPVIAVAGHDTASAVAAVPAENERFAYLSSGTWSLMGIEVPEPIISDETYDMNFTNEGGVDGTTRFLKNITGMWLLEQCLVVWTRRGQVYTYTQIGEMARAETPSPAVIDPDAPELVNPADMIEAIEACCRRLGVPVPQSDAALMRLIFDSLAAKYAEVFERLRRVAPFPLECLHVIGGGALNALLNQLTADKIGAPVVAGPSEATVLGNVLVQARALGVVDSLQQMRDYLRRNIETTTFQPKL